MKKLAFLSLIASLCIFAGCYGGSSSGAGESKGGDVSESSAATPQDYSRRPPEQFDSASSGGSKTQATTDPYTHNNGTTISQNINPTPFIGSSVGALRGENPQNATTNLATNRSVGEMEGATDQPPGAVAPGEMGPAAQPMGLSAQPFGGIGEGNTPARNTGTTRTSPTAKPKPHH